MRKTTGSFVAEADGDAANEGSGFTQGLGHSEPHCLPDSPTYLMSS